MSNPRDGSEDWFVSEEEIDRIANGRRERPGAPAAEREVRAIWRHSALPAGPDDWRELSARLAPHPPARTGWRWRSATLPLAAAAMLAAVLTGVQLRSNLHGPGESARLSQLEVSAGATRTIVLAEGVEVRVAAASVLSYPSAPRPGETEVVLDGEAFFSVEPGAPHTLLVRTPSGDVRDIGTRFNVRARGDRVVVAVEQGAVELSAAGTSVLVEAGRQSSARAGGAPSAATPADLRSHMAWLDGRISVVDEPLIEVFAEIERRYATRVELDSTLRSERLTATLRSQDLEETMSTVCAAIAAVCTSTARGWTVESRS